MKRVAQGVCLMVVVALAVMGCSKESGLEGKVVDGKGNPISGLKIVAKQVQTQVQPIKGYEQFETTTGSDGSFTFSGLLSVSEYILMPRLQDWSAAPLMTLKYEEKKLVALFNKEGWTTNKKMSIQSGPKGQTLKLASPIMVQPTITAVEGKVVDGRGQPMANVTVTAKLANAIPDYAQFETTTGADGGFRFEKLFPGGEYVFVPSSAEWSSSTRKDFQAGAEQQTLQVLLSVRYTMSKAKVITDSKTGLQWTPDLLQAGMSWEKAQAYVAQLKHGDLSGWRLPTRAELRGLYIADAGANYIDLMFQLGDCCYWSGEVDGAKSAWAFSFYYGDDLSANRDRSDNNYIRVFAVRSPIL